MYQTLGRCPRLALKQHLWRWTDIGLEAQTKKSRGIPADPAASNFVEAAVSAAIARANTRHYNVILPLSRAQPHVSQ